MSDGQRELAFDYIWNAGNGRVKILQFDEDHEPIGPMLRKYMVNEMWAYEHGVMLIADRPPRKYWSEPCKHNIVGYCPACEFEKPPDNRTPRNPKNRNARRKR